MTNGYFGKILNIDLSKEEFRDISLTNDDYREFLGGYGLGCKLIYERMKAKIDPLSEESILGFFPGLLTGTAAPFSGRYMVMGKSPLTETWGDANSGGTYGPAIKKCGYDGILITGKALSPKYVTILNGIKKIEDATNIWGLDIIEAEERLREKHGKHITTAGIGVAGEKLSKISGIANDKGRIAARSGLGAIMGSKRLKMIALNGKQKIPIYDKNKFLELIGKYNKAFQGKENKFMTKMIGQFPKIPKLISKMGGSSGSASLVKNIYQNYGTPFANTISAISGDSPVKNWDGVGIEDFPYDKVKNISVHQINKYKVREYGCFSCPVQCGAILKVPELDIEETHLPEYETCAAFGTLLLNDDLISIIQINEMCNRAAIDTISTGGTIAFAIECFEKGIISKEETGGLELTWGNSSAIVELTKKIIEREGIGDILADGSRIASRKLGKESEKYVITSLGSELPMHDPKAYNSLALSYAYDPTPGRHTTACGEYQDIGAFDKFETNLQYPKKRYEPLENKIQSLYLNTVFHQFYCSAGLCLFARFVGEYPFMELINALTGWDLNTEEVLKTGLRIQTLRQAFNLREDFPLMDNELPGRSIGNPPQDSGPNKGITVEYKELYKELCEKLGWNHRDGVPLKQTLNDLNLGFTIKDLF